MFADGGWAPTVADGGCTHECTAPSAGPPRWHVFEFAPEADFRTTSTIVSMHK